MKWKSQWTRTFSLAVGICPYGRLEEQDEEICSADTFLIFPESFQWYLNEAIRRGTSTSDVYVVIVWICLAQRMPHIQLWAVRKWRFGRFHWRPCEVRLPAQRMTSFNEVRIHNPFACHVLVHIINIKPSSTPLSLISPGLDVHAVGAPPPPLRHHHPCFRLPLPGWMSSFPYVTSCLLSVHSFTCMKSPDVESAFWPCCQFTLRLILWQCS